METRAYRLQSPSLLPVASVFATQPIVTVQQLAGHTDPATTSRYDRRKEEIKRRAVQVLDLLCL
jgi:integrase